MSEVNKTPDVTDEDRRNARKWAEDSRDYGDPGSYLDCAVRVILAAVPAPPKSLAEQILDIAGHISSDFGAYADDLTALADRVEDIERDNISVNAALRTVTDERNDARDEARDWREQNENDCEAYSEELADARADLLREGTFVDEWRQKYARLEGQADRLAGVIEKLIGVLVPPEFDPRRVIDRPEDLDKLPVGSIVLAEDGDAWRKDSDGDFQTAGGWLPSEKLIYLCGPVSVIYEPEVVTDGVPAD